METTVGHRGRNRLHRHRRPRLARLLHRPARRRAHCRHVQHRPPGGRGDGCPVGTARQGGGEDGPAVSDGSEIFRRAHRLLRPTHPSDRRCLRGDRLPAIRRMQRRELPAAHQRRVQLPRHRTRRQRSRRLDRHAERQHPGIGLHPRPRDGQRHGSPGLLGTRGRPVAKLRRDGQHAVALVALHFPGRLRGRTGGVVHPVRMAHHPDDGQLLPQAVERPAERRARRLHLRGQHRGHLRVAGPGHHAAVRRQRAERPVHQRRFQHPVLPALGGIPSTARPTAPPGCSASS